MKEIGLIFSSVLNDISYTIKATFQLSLTFVPGAYIVTAIRALPNGVAGCGQGIPNLPGSRWKRRLPLVSITH
jgi:hypothetical protein